jgi:demethylmenaquinone methyltransferase/2-methoxy-6-polyprenyl-1,4-benzoquinol methylase
VNDQIDDLPDAAALVSSQMAYYDLRAPEYLDTSKSDRREIGAMAPKFVAEVVDEIGPSGDALELACGTGVFTRELVRRVRSLTAIDASPKMLERNREMVRTPAVHYVEADLFAWQPDRAYDMVFFSFWLSHVPPSEFDRFWALVRRCLAPGGRVAFVDEDDRASERQDSRLVDGVPSARRTLSDGRTFDIVKVFWDPADLERRLQSAGWDVSVRCVGASFLCGVGSLLV